MPKNKPLLLVILSLILLFSSALAEESPIVIGIAYPAAIDGETRFIQGVYLAQEKINAGGGILNRELVFDIKDDKNDATTARQIAQGFVDAGVQAVIGHWGSNICSVAEETYETNGIIMLSPAATSMALLKPSQRYIFRMIPNNDDNAHTLAAAFSGAGYENIAIYFSDDVYGTTFSQTIERALHEKGIHVIDRICTLSPAAMETVADRWQAFGCDAIVIAATMPEAANAIELIRALPVSYPIYGADNFARSSLKDSLQRDLRNIFHVAHDESKIDADFSAAFKLAYDAEADVFAIAGYEAVMLLYDAMTAANTTEAAAIADYLSGIADYESITGALSFDAATREFLGHSLIVRPAK